MIQLRTKMVEDIFGIAGARYRAWMEIPEQWLLKFSKIDEAEAAQRFRRADIDGSGRLRTHEFATVVAAVLPGLDPGEVEGMLSFCDVNRSGFVDYNEFMAWFGGIRGDHVKKDHRER